MRYLLWIWLLLLPGLATAQLVAQQEWTTESLLAGFVFGQAPGSEMICFKGPCLDELVPNQAPQSRTIISSYKKPLDITFLNGVEITSPRYDFHDNVLFRVTFNLLCSSEESEACIAAVAGDLQQALGLTLDHSYNDTWDDDLRLRLLRFTNSSGMTVRIDMRKISGNWEKPFVEISDRQLMEQVRRAANPDYQPK